MLNLFWDQSRPRPRRRPHRERCRQRSCCRPVTIGGPKAPSSPTDTRTGFASGLWPAPKMLLPLSGTPRIQSGFLRTHHSRRSSSVRRSSHPRRGRRDRGLGRSSCQRSAATEIDARTPEAIWLRRGCSGAQAAAIGERLQTRVTCQLRLSNTQTPTSILDPLRASGV